MMWLIVVICNQSSSEIFTPSSLSHFSLTYEVVFPFLSMKWPYIVEIILLIIIFMFLCTISFHSGWTRPWWSCRCRGSGARSRTPQWNSLLCQTTSAAPGTGSPYTRYTVFHAPPPSMSPPSLMHWVSAAHRWASDTTKITRPTCGPRESTRHRCATCWIKKSFDFLQPGWISAQLPSPSLSPQQVSFSEEDLPRDDCEYMLGYYSNNMNSIVGLSTTIQVCEAWDGYVTGVRSSL